jgi:hypothetical protein
MRTTRALIGRLAAYVMAVWLMAGPVQAAREAYSFGYDAIGQAEKVLRQAAVKSPKWHSKQDSIERDVYDITFFLEQAWRAAESGNGEAMREYAHQALAVLQRAVARGHFDQTQVEPVMALIQRFLPNVPV